MEYHKIWQLKKYSELILFCFIKEKFEISIEMYRYKEGFNSLKINFLKYIILKFTVDYQDIIF